MAYFSFGIRSQLQDWHSQGLINEELLKKLNADLDRQKSSRSFSSIAIILGVICLCFGVMTFVAANWEEMSRFVRLCILLLAITGSYTTASILDHKGKTWFAQSFVLLGCGCFGATVMLVGQMYHLPGHASGAVLLWCLGTLAAAAFVKSVPALVLGIVLGTIWSCWYMADISGFEGIHYWYLLIWGVCAGLSWYLRSRFSAHVAALGLHVWFLFTLVETLKNSDLPLVAAICICVAMLLISALIWSHDNKSFLRGFELSAVSHLALFALVQLSIWYVLQVDGSWFRDSELSAIFTETPFGFGVVFVLFLSLALWRIGNGKSRFDHVVSTILIAGTLLTYMVSANDVPFVLEGFSLLFTIWMIRMGTRQESVTVTRLGYIGFIIAMLSIYAAAAGGLLGTSVFYIIAGLLLVVGALLAPRISGRKKIENEVTP